MTKCRVFNHWMKLIHIISASKIHVVLKKSEAQISVTKMSALLKSSFIGKQYYFAIKHIRMVMEELPARTPMSECISIKLVMM